MSECQSVRGEWGQPCPDCGQTLPVAKPWEHGRPCAKTALDRGRGWDGRPAPEHTEGVKSRWSKTQAAPLVQQAPLTPRQQKILSAVRRHGGNRSRAAAELEMSLTGVCYVLERLPVGVVVPPAVRGRPRVVRTAVA